MRNSWITARGTVRRDEGSISSDLASTRYRVLLPIQGMGPWSHQHEVFMMAPDTPDLTKKALQADAMVFSKSVLPANEDLARKARSLGISVLFDVCDDHFQHPRYGEHYRSMAGLANRVVCNTTEMAKVTGAYSSDTPVVIEDPYEGPKGAAAFKPGKRLNLLWFGQKANLSGLQESLKDLNMFSSRMPISLTVLTNIDAEIEQAYRQVDSRFGDGFTVSAKPWSLGGQWRELAGCDAVIIPSVASPTTRVKSANRMIEALWAGKPVVAQPMPGYLPFDRWTPVRGKLSEGLEWLLTNQRAVPAQVSEAQDHIERHYAPAVLAAQWEQTIRSQVARSRPA